LTETPPLVNGPQHSQDCAEQLKASIEQCLRRKNGRGIFQVETVEAHRRRQHPTTDTQHHNQKPPTKSTLRGGDLLPL